MLSDTDNARKAIEMIRNNPRTSYLDFMAQLNMDENSAKLLYGNIITSDEL